MADPLSMTASIIAVAGLVRVATKGIQRILALKSAPGLILELSHEVKPQLGRSVQLSY
jgi:hypothetical protein